MPIMTSELAQGYATGRTKSEGSTGITYTRVFKVLLSSPNEGWDIQQVCGIHIGDYYPSDNRVTCTSFQDRADGDSRVVRLVRTKPTQGIHRRAAALAAAAAAEVRRIKLQMYVQQTFQRVSA